MKTKEKNKNKNQKATVNCYFLSEFKKSSVFHFKENLETYKQKENIKLKA